MIGLDAGDHALIIRSRAWTIYWNITGEHYGNIWEHYGLNSQGLWGFDFHYWSSVQVFDRPHSFHAVSVHQVIMSA